MKKIFFLNFVFKEKCQKNTTFLKMIQHFLQIPCKKGVYKMCWIIINGRDFNIILIYRSAEMLLRGCSLHVFIQLPYFWSRATLRSFCPSTIAWQKNRPIRLLTGLWDLNMISSIISRLSSREIPLTMSTTRSKPSLRLIPKTPFGCPPMRCFEKKEDFKKHVRYKHSILLP